MTPKLLLALSSLVFLNGLCFAEPLTKVRFQLDWYPDAERGGYLAALVHGYYKDAGLDVEIIPAVAGISNLGNVVFGNSDICMSGSDDVMFARSKGMPLVSIMATMQHDPQAVMVHDESPIKSLADLEGQAIEVSPGALWFAYVIQKYHYQHVKELRENHSVSGFLHDPHAIQQVFVTSEPYICQQQNVKVRCMLIHDIGFDPYRVAITTDKYLAHHPDTVKAFVQASIRGWKKYLEDSTMTDAEILKRNPAMDPGLLAYSRNVIIQDHFFDGFPDKGEAPGKLDPARYASEYKILTDLKLLPNDFDYTQSFTTQFCNSP